MSSASEGIYNQVQGAVPINIDQCGPRTIEIRTGNTGLFGNIFELPVPKIAVETVAAFQAAEIDITSTVTIHVTGGHTRAAGKYLAGQEALLGNGIGENNTRLLSRHEGEPVLAGSTGLQGRSAVAWTALPFKGLRHPYSEDDR